MSANYNLKELKGSLSQAWSELGRQESNEIKFWLEYFSHFSSPKISVSFQDSTYQDLLAAYAEGAGLKPEQLYKLATHLELGHTNDFKRDHLKSFLPQGWIDLTYQNQDIHLELWGECTPLLHLKKNPTIYHWKGGPRPIWFLALPGLAFLPLMMGPSEEKWFLSLWPKLGGGAHPSASHLYGHLWKMIQTKTRAPDYRDLKTLSSLSRFGILVTLQGPEVLSADIEGENQYIQTWHLSETPTMFASESLHSGEASAFGPEEVMKLSLHHKRQMITSHKGKNAEENYQHSMRFPLLSHRPRQWRFPMLCPFHLKLNKDETLLTGIQDHTLSDYQMSHSSLLHRNSTAAYHYLQMSLSQVPQGHFEDWIKLAKYTLEFSFIHQKVELGAIYQDLLSLCKKEGPWKGQALMLLYLFEKELQLPASNLHQDQKVEEYKKIQEQIDKGKKINLKRLPSLRLDLFAVLWNKSLLHDE